MERIIPSVEQNLNEANQIISQKKFCQSFYINAITIEFYEIDDYVYYFTQLPFNIEFMKFFKLLEVISKERRTSSVLESLC